LRAHLDRTRDAIREGRFEDASTALTAAEALAGEDRSEVRLLADELAAARSAQRVDEVLALANQRLGRNALIEPSNDNARYYYELALSTDPGNTAAQQGLTIVASKLVLRARAAIDAGQLDEAGSLLQDAGELDPAGSELAATLQALQATRADGEALRLAELQTEAAQPAAAGSGGAAAPGGTTPEPGTGASAGLPGLGASFTANRSVEGSLGEPLTAGSTGGQNSDPDAFVPISSLKRTNYVVPEYPRAAQRRNITGWVDVSFTVTERGDVVDVGIMNSDPGDIFNEAATDAISQWRFEPSIENGLAVPKRVAVRLSFDLQ
jgi:protein TonB